MLSNEEINRYSRQMILPGVSVDGQILLKKSSVLIVGAGGLGCPSSIYLAGAGVGHIGILDYDEVELNNLHRQILHTEQTVGKSKVESVTSALNNLNSNITVTPFQVELNSSNALDIISKFDVVVDATDNVVTRYLLNDACFFCKKPLVSGSALMMEGQLTVYHHNNGPCYRCLFPVPPPAVAVTNCGEGGVLGVIPGTIGVLQALQVINILLKKDTLAGVLLLFDGSDCSFRRVKLRNRSPNCALCGEKATIKSLVDYETFCDSKANDKNPDLRLLTEDQRVTPLDFQQLRETPHILIDVRSAQEFKICNLPNSFNVPIKEIENESAIEKVRSILPDEGNATPIYVICRRGNDSQKAAIKLSEIVKGHPVKDIIGGLHGWSRDVDPLFPIY